MREILFRGKRKDNGEWVYGDLRHISDGHGGYILCIVDNTNGRNNDVTGVEVVPETVGQYTGLTDDNGVKIFEGDIVKIEGGDWRIGYSNALAKFLAFNSWGIRRNIPIYSEREVIGNIHDTR